MLPDVDYEEHEIHLKKGDRLILYSDGITECMNSEDEQFSVRRLIHLAQKVEGQPLQALMKQVSESLYHWKGDDAFEDDVTLLAMEML